MVIIAVYDHNNNHFFELFIFIRGIIERYYKSDDLRHSLYYIDNSPKKETRTKKLF